MEKEILIIAMPQEGNGGFDTLFQKAVLQVLDNRKIKYTFLTNNPAFKGKKEIIFIEDYSRYIAEIRNIKKKEYEAVISLVPIYKDHSILLIMANFYKNNCRYAVIEYDIEYSSKKFKKPLFYGKILNIFCCNMANIVKSLEGGPVDYKQFYKGYSDKIGATIHPFIARFPIDFSQIENSRTVNKAEDYILILGSGDRDYEILNKCGISKLQNLLFLLDLEDLKKGDTEKLKNMQAANPQIRIMGYKPFKNFIDILCGAKAVVIPIRKGSYCTGNISLFYSLALGKKVFITKNENTIKYKAFAEFIDANTGNRLKEYAKIKDYYDQSASDYARKNNAFSDVFSDILNKLELPK